MELEGPLGGRHGTSTYHVVKNDLISVGVGYNFYKIFNDIIYVSPLIQHMCHILSKIGYLGSDEVRPLPQFGSSRKTDLIYHFIKISEVHIDPRSFQGQINWVVLDHFRSSSHVAETSRPRPLLRWVESGQVRDANRTEFRPAAHGGEQVRTWCKIGQIWLFLSAGRTLQVNRSQKN